MSCQSDKVKRVVRKIQAHCASVSVSQVMELISRRLALAVEGRVDCRLSHCREFRLVWPIAATSSAAISSPRACPGAAAAISPPRAGT